MNMKTAKRLTRAQKDKAGMLKPSGQSKYGRKRAYLAALPPDERAFGFQIAAPKPWK